MQSVSPQQEVTLKAQVGSLWTSRLHVTSGDSTCSGDAKRVPPTRSNFEGTNSLKIANLIERYMTNFLISITLSTYIHHQQRQYLWFPLKNKFFLEQNLMCAQHKVSKNILGTCFQRVIRLHYKKEHCQ